MHILFLLLFLACVIFGIRELGKLTLSKDTMTALTIMATIFVSALLYVGSAIERGIERRIERMQEERSQR